MRFLVLGMYNRWGDSRWGKEIDDQVRRSLANGKGGEDDTPGVDLLGWTLGMRLLLFYVVISSNTRSFLRL